MEKKYILLMFAVVPCMVYSLPVEHGVEHEATHVEEHEAEAREYHSSGAPSEGAIVGLGGGGGGPVEHVAGPSSREVFGGSSSEEEGSVGFDLDKDAGKIADSLSAGMRFAIESRIEAVVEDGGGRVSVEDALRDNKSYQELSEREKERLLQEARENVARTKSSDSEEESPQRKASREKLRSDIDQVGPDGKPLYSLRELLDYDDVNPEWYKELSKGDITAAFYRLRGISESSAVTALRNDVNAIAQALWKQEGKDAIQNLLSDEPVTESPLSVEQAASFLEQYQNLPPSRVDSIILRNRAGQLSYSEGASVRYVKVKDLFNYIKRGADAGGPFASLKGEIDKISP